MVRHIDTWSEYYILSFITVYKEMGVSIDVARAYQDFMVEINQINTSFILKKKEVSYLLSLTYEDISSPSCSPYENYVEHTACVKTLILE